MFRNPKISIKQK